MAKNEPPKNWSTWFAALQNSARRAGEGAERLGHALRNQVNRELAEENAAAAAGAAGNGVAAAPVEEEANGAVPAQGVRRGVRFSNNSMARQFHKNNAPMGSFTRNLRVRTKTRNNETTEYPNNNENSTNAPSAPNAPRAAGAGPSVINRLESLGRQFQRHVDNELAQNAAAAANEQARRGRQSRFEERNQANANRYREWVRGYYAEKAIRRSMGENLSPAEWREFTQYYRSTPEEIVEYLQDLRNLERALIGIGTNSVTARRQASELAFRRRSQQLNRELKEMEKQRYLLLANSEPANTRFTRPRARPLATPRHSVHAPPPPPKSKRFITIVCNELGKCFAGLRARTAKKKNTRRNTNQKRKTRKNNSK